MATQWSEEAADLIPYEDKLKEISHSTWWSEGAADLIPYEDKLKEISHVNMVVRGGGGFDPL